MTTHSDSPAGASLVRHSSVLSQSIGNPDHHAQDDGQVDLKTYLNVLFDSRWLIAGIALAVTVAALVYALAAQPVFEANMLIHVEEVSPNASKNILNEVSSLFETKKAAIAEMELLRSRTVITPAVDKLRLYIAVQPHYFPVAGNWLAERAEGHLSEPGLFGWGGYVWGAERLEVSLFDVPDALQNRGFSVIVTGPRQFRVEQDEHHIAFNGTVGQTLMAGALDGNIALRVDRLDARPGARFTLRRSSRLNAIEEIQRALKITEEGKQSGVIEVRLQGQNAAVVQAILTEIGAEYMRQNLARKTEEAEKSLAFLNRQLPELKQQLEKAEAQYNIFRNQHGTVDLNEEARISLQRAAAAKTRRLELLEKKTELLTRFTSRHPMLIGVNMQLKEVDDEIAEVAGHIKTLPLLEQDQVRLTRDIKVNTDLYTALSNTAQQLRIISVGKVSNVRLVDQPVVPEQPLKPNRGLIVGVAAVAGVILGIVCAFLRKAVFGGIDDPKKVEQLLGARVVYASIPHSANQVELNKRAEQSSALPVLAREFPEDAAIENLRSFRAALKFSMPHFSNNIVMFTGPTAGLGKSFVSVNFAAVMAASGKRVLLIDADLRNGHLNQFFDTERQRGLTEAINGALRLEQVIRREVMPNLDFMPTGALPPNRAEFLMHVNFGAVLEAVCANYDLVLIDPPPVLAVADALIIGAHAGAVFLLVRAGVTTEGEITESIKRLGQAGIAPHGVLFNDLKLRLGGYGYQYKYRGLNQIEYAS
ncbi:MAG: polysaccharide biosynthesis tyrosine autokinase [Pseudomonadota bacterium]